MSNMDKKTDRLGMMVVRFFIGFCLGTFLANRCDHHFADGNKKVADTVRVVIDTTWYDAPMSTDSVVTGEIRVPVVLSREPSVPKADVKVFPPSEMDSVSQGQETDKIGSNDTVWATVPRTQKRYEDSTYTAWVSGYEPRLDSIEVYQKTVTITKRVEGRVKNRRFNVGLTGGFGYGVFTRKPDVWVGVGCTWRIF